MLIDDEARTLLHRAADTIEVGPGEPIPARRPRPWLAPTTAAAAAIVLVGALVAGLTRDPGQDPAPAPQTPAPQTPASSGPVVPPRAADEELTVPGLELSLSQLSVAQTFLAWARGQAGPPPFADRVAVLLEDEPFTRLTAEEARVRGSWSFCSGAASDSCDVHVLRALEKLEGQVRLTRGPDGCGGPGPRRLPAALAADAETRMVRLDATRAPRCEDDLAVELWVTALGRVRAVNLRP